MGFVTRDPLKPTYGPSANVDPFTPEDHSARQEQQRIEEANKSSVMDTVVAGFEMNNILLSHGKFIENKPDETTDQEKQDYISGKFNIMESIPEEHKGNTDYEKQYLLHARKPEDIAWIAGNIERENQNRQALEDNPVTGLISTIAAASTSPEQIPMFAIPAAKVLKLGAIAKLSMSKAVAYEGAVAGVAAGLGEGVLHQSQLTRTKTESMYAVGGSVMLGGALTGFVYGFKGGAKALRELDDDMAKIDSNPDIQNMGAAKTNLEEPLPDELKLQVEKQVDDLIAEGKIPKSERAETIARVEAEEFSKLSQLKHPTLAKVLGFIHPSIRIARSSLDSARTLGQKLVADPMLRRGNEYGMTPGPAVETDIDSLVNTVNAQMYETATKQYTNYAKSVIDGPKLKPAEFDEQVGMAMSRGDKHENQFVEAAAKKMRNIVAPIEKRLLDAGLLDSKYTGFDDITPSHVEEYLDPEDAAKFFDASGKPIPNLAKKMPAELKDALAADGVLGTKAKLPYGDESYIHRLWNFDKIGAGEQAFMNDVVKALRKEANDKLDAHVIREEEKLADMKTELEQQTKPAKDTGETRGEGERIVAKNLKKELQEKQATKLKNYNNRIRTEMNKAEPDMVQIKKLEDARTAVRAEFKKASRKETISLSQRIREQELDIGALRKSNALYKQQGLENELSNAAREVKNSLTGANARQGHVIPSFSSGPLKNRTFMIQSKELEQWINRNSSEVWNNWIENVTPSLTMHERFGSADLVDDIKAIHKEYDDLIGATGNKKTQAKLQKERDATVRDINAMVESLHGRYKVPDDPTSLMSKAGRNLRAFNFVTMLGMMTVSAIPDVGHIVMRRGFKSTAKGLANLVTFNKGTKMSNKMWRSFGTAADLYNNQRVNRMMFLDDQYGRATRFDRGVMKATTLFSKASGMVHWNAGWKQFNATVFADDMIGDAIKLSKGQLDKKAIRQYAQGGLSSKDMKAIAKEFEAQADNMADGVHLPDPNAWGDQALASRFKSAITREVDMTIVTPGKGDLPLASRGEIGRLALQFKSFAMSSNLRVLIATLDDFSAKKAYGIMSMIFMGGVAQLSRDAIKGTTPDYSTNEGLRSFFDNSVDRSGLLGVWADVNAMAEKLTRGKISIKLGNKPLSRYQSRNIMGTILGPMGGRVEDIGSVVGAITNGEFAEKEARSMRRMALGNTLIFSYWFFDQLEKAMGGTPQRDK